MNRLIEPCPYKLINQIQHYDWGTTNNKAFIPKLLYQKIELNKPYAELWIGAHPKASSEILIDGKTISLNKLINKYPIDILGKKVAEKFKYTLPFLLKVLSIDKPLSIQAHPNKKLATKLFKLDPRNYPDSNHKPEIAIAIDKLDLIVGIKNYKNLKQTLIKYDGLRIILGKKFYDEFFSININNESIIKKLIKEILHASHSNLEICILSIVETINKSKIKSEIEKHFLKAFSIYGIDPGLIFMLFLNYKEIIKDEAIFTCAGIPHAYLSGNIIECMANSDNVVRVGLTNKFKDVKTLFNMIEIDLKLNKVKVLKDQNRIIYKTSAEEFEVSSLTLNSAYSKSIILNHSLTILLILEGKLKIEWSSKEKILSQILKKGESVLIPNNLNSVVINKIWDSKIYSVTVP